MQPPMDDLCDLIARHTPAGEAHPVPGVTFRAGTTVMAPFAVVLDPMLCFVVQGAKSVVVGDEVMTYGPDSVLALSLHLPVTGRLVAGSEAAPYLAMALHLDPATLAGLVADLPGAATTDAGSFTVSPMDPAIGEPLLRLARLAEAPDDAPVLGPLAIREILYRSLRGPMGPLLREYARGDGRTAQVRRAVDWMVAHFAERISVDDLAGIAGMSTTSFHRHFKAVTAMSPLGFLKRVRLHKARDLLIATGTSVSQAAFAVGYESPSQFSREYLRQFGKSPAEDAGRVMRPRGARESWRSP